MEVERKEFQGHHYHIGRAGDIVWGFTEKGFPIELFAPLFPGFQLKYLKQIHSNIILKSSQIEPDSQGDGIIVDEANTLAVIKTADCVPLFFWEPSHALAGILHIGWRGFEQGIQLSMLQIIQQRGVALENSKFFIGPCIEGTCYEVGEDLYQKFAPLPERSRIFTPLPNGKYHLDISAGITHSLQAQGAKSENIRDIGICTRCNWRTFPSYRKNGKTGQRIFNFLMINK